jgi:DNA-binding beta-propeller fold protein YncE
MTVISGKLGYALVEGWEQLPANLNHADVAGVAVDSADRVFIITRAQSRVIVYNRDGSFAAAWGDGMLTPRTHGITVAPDDTVYCVDDGRHAVFHFDRDGELLRTFGTPNVPSNTGYRTAGGLSSITQGAGPFNRPTNLAISPSGDLYVSDGYGNSRVHRFSAGGELIQSWGEPGLGPGQFHLPHGIAVTGDGRVLVADRENDRIQIFSPDGEYLEEWTDVQRPTHIAVDAAGLVYVSELWRRSEDVSRRLGFTPDDHHGRVSVYEPDGTVLLRLGGPDRCAPGNFIAPHGIAVDSTGDVYVSEVSQSFAIRRGLVPEGSHTLQKFTRVAA